MENDNDFGFSLVSEEEIKKHETELKKKVEEQSALTLKINSNVESLQKKMEGIRVMISPLLNNLSASPEKSYIFWPDRAEKIKEFSEKLNEYIDS